MVPRFAFAMIWLLSVGSVHAAYMKGTLTFDDGRTATLTLRRFKTYQTPNEVNRIARFRCCGSACFTPTGDLGYELPFEGRYDFEFYYDTPGPGRVWTCDTQALGLKHSGVCRIRAPVICVLDDYTTYPFLHQVVATGALDLHRTTPRCRRIVRRGGQ
jgi:hypothetical protein